MTYFSPYISEAGLHLPTYDDILEKRIQDLKAIYGQNIYLEDDALDYQLLAVESLAIYDCMQALQLLYNQISPVTAIGVGLSSLVQINGVTRRSATYSTCTVVLTGTNSVTITDGVVMDDSGYKWNLPSPITLQDQGGGVFSLTVTATCQTIGDISAGVGEITTIVTPFVGWTSVTNPTVASLGTAIETDSELRERQALSVALPSQTILDGTIAGISSIEGVTRLKVYENATNSTTFGVDGVPFEGAPAHSITAVVEGGTTANIAEIIYNNRGLGCYTNGDVVTNITDEVTGTVTPIRFYRPTYVDIYVEVQIQTLNGYTSGDVALIKTAIADYINSLDIGETLVVSSIGYAAVGVIPNQTRPTFSIKSTKIGETISPLTTDDIVAGYNEAFTIDETMIDIIEL